MAPVNYSSDFCDRFADRDFAIANDAGVHTAQALRLARGAVDENHRSPAESLDELGAAGVWRVGDFKQRAANRESGAGRQILWAQVHIDEQVVASQCPSTAFGGNQIDAA